MNKWSALLIIPALMLLTSCGTTTSDTTLIPKLTEEQKSFAIQAIEDYPEVLDAAVVQEAKQLSLVIFVDYATSKERAKQLGDSFVRLVKTYGPEPAPSKIVGEGTFDYLVGVYYPNEELVVQGAKVSFSEHITW